MIIVAFGLIGLIFGSFVNAAVWRMHEQAELAGKKGKVAIARRKALSISKGRSMCPSCEHELAAKDLIPIVSWLWLRGKCRYCKARIPDSPVVEAATAILFALSYAAWPFGYHGVGLFMLVCWCIFLVAFMLLAVYDLRWCLLPDRIVLPLIALAGLEALVIALWLHSFSAVWQPAVAAVIIFGLFWILFQVSDGTWIGGGDVKLAIVLGLLAATPARAFMVIFFASLLGTLVSIPLLAKGGKNGLKVQIPFGPYLLGATIIVVLFGSHIISWYQNLLV